MDWQGESEEKSSAATEKQGLAWQGKSRAKKGLAKELHSSDLQGNERNCFYSEFKTFKKER